MEIADREFENDFICDFQVAVKTVSFYLYVSFLEICKGYDLCPAGLSIRTGRFEAILERDTNRI